MKTKPYWMLPIIVISLSLGGALYILDGGYLHPETDMYVVDHLSDRSWISKVLCPSAVDANDYMGRPLSHVMENVDAHFIHFCCVNGCPHFYSAMSLFMAAGIGVILWKSARLMNLNPITSALLLALLFTSPFLFFSLVDFRDAKPASGFFVALGVYFVLRKTVRCDPITWKTGVVCFGIATAACLSDPEGAFLVLVMGFWSILISRLAFAWVGIGAMGAFAFHSVLTVPVLRRAIPHVTWFTTTTSTWNALHGRGLRLWPHRAWDGFGLTLTTVGRIFGDMPDWISVVLLAAGFILMRRYAPGRSLRNVIFAVVALLGTLTVMNCAMAAKHPPILWPDVRIGSYFLPAAVLVVFLAAFCLSRYPLRDTVLWPILVFAVLLNINAIPKNWSIIQGGHLAGFIAASPYMLEEIQKVESQPAQPPLAYDAKMCALSVDMTNSLYNSKPDLDGSGYFNFKADAYFNTSRLYNYLRAERGMPYHRQWVTDDAN